MAISHSSSLEGLVFPEKSPVRPETMTSSRPPSRGTLSTLVPIAPSANDSDIEASPANGSDIEAPLGKETIRIIARLDAKEKEAAQKYIDQVKTKRYEAKQRELKKQWRWRWRSDHSFLNKMAEVKRLIELEAGNPTSPMTYEEIKRLLFIEKHSIYAKALGEWSRKEVLFTDRMERKKTMVASVKNETFQLIGWFVAFQSFLFTGVAGSNLLHCNNKWYPIFLSMLASFVTVAGIVLKMIRIKEIQTTTQKRDERPLEVIFHILFTLLSK